MKKITKIAATFAAAMAILFGAASCSHDGGASLAALSLTDDDDDDDDKNSPVTVNAVWDFKADTANASAWITELSESGNWNWDSGSDVKGKVKDTEQAISTTSGTGAKFTFLKTSKSIESGGSSGWKVGTNATPIGLAYIKVDGACTVTIKGKDGGDKKEDGTIRSFYVSTSADGSGTKSVDYSQSGTAAADFEKSFEATAGKTYYLFAAGVNFYSITCTPPAE